MLLQNQRMHFTDGQSKYCSLVHEAEINGHQERGLHPSRWGATSLVARATIARLYEISSGITIGHRGTGMHASGSSTYAVQGSKNVKISTRDLHNYQATCYKFSTESSVTMQESRIKRAEKDGEQQGTSVGFTSSNPQSTQTLCCVDTFKAHVAIICMHTQQCCRTSPRSQVRNTRSTRVAKQRCSNCVKCDRRRPSALWRTKLVTDDKKRDSDQALTSAFCSLLVYFSLY